MYSILRWRKRSPTRNSRSARSLTEVRLQDSNAFRAAFIAGSTCSLPAFWWMPTISEGRVVLSERILSVVLTRLPPTIRSYSRPSWPRTFSIAERILRAFSSRVKSKKGSVTNGPSWRRTRGRGGAWRVAIGVILSGLEDSVVGRAEIFYTSDWALDGSETRSQTGY